MLHPLSGLDLHAQIMVVNYYQSLLGRLSPRSLSALDFAGSSSLLGLLEGADFSRCLILRRHTEVGYS